jgi:hypothetical protein
MIKKIVCNENFVAINNKPRVLITHISKQNFVKLMYQLMYKTSKKI